MFTASSNTLIGVGVSAVKDGFYQSGSGYKFKSVESGKYQPWNPTIELVLRKKINPVPMYAKNVNHLIFPSLTEPVGYDFLVGDWVDPYGKGKVKDLVFTFKLDYEKEVKVWNPHHGEQTEYKSEYQIEIKMPNKEDGFCPITQEKIFPESEFKLPYEAPEEGYVEKLIFTSDAEKNIKSLEPDADNYFIRIRTELDENGKVKKACYGKFLFSDRLNRIGYSKKIGGKCIVSFVYYVNPDGTRNIEFDPEKNLFDKRKLQRSGEDVSNP